MLARLSALNEGAVALVDKVDKSQVKSPVRGRVQRLLANTVGGVVSPGKDIVEVVPLDDALVLEAKIEPRDIAFIHPGQAATVKFSAYDFSIYGGLDAVVENISPDTVTVTVLVPAVVPSVHVPTDVGPDEDFVGAPTSVPPPLVTATSVPPESKRGPPESPKQTPPPTCDSFSQAPVSAASEEA